jgi:hypothetical protein
MVQIPFLPQVPDVSGIDIALRLLVVIALVAVTGKYYTKNKLLLAIEAIVATYVLMVFV